MDDNVNYDQQGPCVLANESIIDCQVTSSQQVVHPPYTREVCTLRLWWMQEDAYVMSARSFKLSSWKGGQGESIWDYVPIQQHVSYWIHQ